jgi:Domain of unknown function (DUF1931)
MCLSRTSQSSNASSAWPAGLDVDKTDLKRYSDFVHRKAYDLLL